MSRYTSETDFFLSIHFLITPLPPQVDALEERLDAIEERVIEDHPRP